MPNPIRVEETFQTLVEDVEVVESVRQRIVMLRDFFYLFDGNYKKYESYIVELIHYWPLFSSPITYSGISPEEIAGDLMLLQEIADEVESLTHLERYCDIINRLREVQFIMFLWMGEMDAALKLLKLTDGLLPMHAIGGSVLDDHDAKWLFINDLRGSLRSESKNNWESNSGLDIRRIVHDLDYILEDRKETEAIVPVVETFQKLDGNEKSYGRLRRLKITVNDEIDQMDDQITRRFNIVGVEKPLLLEDANILMAARNLLERFSPGKITRRFKGKLDFEFSKATHKGRSSNAAIAALWFTGLQKKADLRERYKLNEDVALTGDIDKESGIIPVSRKSIKSKTYAAFYSWINIFVVPASQAEMFRKELFELKEKYPRRKLTLISAERLDDLFYDRRISTHHNPSKINYAASRIWAKKKEVVGLLVILLLSFALLRLAYGPFDINPALYEYNGEFLEILNESGQVLDKLNVGKSTTELAELSGNYKLVDFEDIDDDGVREIFWAKNFPSTSGSVFLKEAGIEEYEWKLDIGKNLVFPNKPYVFKNNYRAYEINAGDFNNDGAVELIVNYAHKPFFPGILSIVNVSTGKEISHFIHPGHINDFLVVNIKKKKKREVIISGINNAFNRAFIAVLDIENISGYGPANDEYYLNGYESAEMIEYVLFPKTIVAGAITQESAYNRAPNVFYNEDYGILEVYLNDFVNYEIESQDKIIEAGRLYVYFDTNFSITQIGTSDEFDVTAEFLYKNKLIDRYPDQEYFNDYIKGILHWNGENFETRSFD